MTIRGNNPTHWFDEWVTPGEGRETIRKVLRRESLKTLRQNDQQNLTHVNLRKQEDIRAVWEYINTPKNVSNLSQKDVHLVRERVIKAWKMYIDPRGPLS